MCVMQTYFKSNVFILYNFLDGSSTSSEPLCILNPLMMVHVDVSDSDIVWSTPLQTMEGFGSPRQATSTETQDQVLTLTSTLAVRGRKEAHVLLVKAHHSLPIFSHSN